MYKFQNKKLNYKFAMFVCIQSPYILKIQEINYTQSLWFAEQRVKFQQNRVNRQFHKNYFFVIEISFSDLNRT